MPRLLAAFALILPLLAVPTTFSAAGGMPAGSDGPALSLGPGADLRRSAAELAALPEARDITLPSDHVHGPGPWQFRAVPLSMLARAAGVEPNGMLAVIASDGFVAQIPGNLALQSEPDRSRAWLAIEPPERPWPNIPGKAHSAGPFYVIWERPELSRISTEYWVYQVVALRAEQRPEQRWPQLLPDAALPADAPERRGMALFLANCLPCHRMSGAGEAELGPDLNRPMNPTRYFQRAALLRYIRDPASVRSWPEQRMTGFPPETLPDTAIEDIVRYLEHMAGR